jgi:ABC-2 type transport system ATP-binding protein
MRLIQEAAISAHGLTDLEARVGGLRLEVTLTHPAAAFAAMVALEDMSEDPPHADGLLVTVTVAERAGAVMEAARRLSRAGVGANDIVVRGPTLEDVLLSLTGHEAAPATRRHGAQARRPAAR